VLLKVEDGARRACEVALVSVLSALGVFTPAERERLAPWVRHPVPNTRGEEAAWLEVGGEECTFGPVLEEA
jgi:L-asparaginase II